MKALVVRMAGTTGNSAAGIILDTGLGKCKRVDAPVLVACHPGSSMTGSIPDGEGGAYSRGW
ncbi:MAG: hypothetical protein HYS12_25695 [Planctomycetes bacterium]|nr:hypothetical protein [Planctomycetota bacterium]